jgi:hypothetical protein
MNILIFYKIHFLRTVYRMIPESIDLIDTSWIKRRAPLIGLLTADTRDDYNKLI